MSFLRRLSTFAALSGVLMVSTAWAAGGEHGPPSTLDEALPLIGQHALNLAILLGLLAYVAAKPIKNALAARRETIRVGIDKAGEAERVARQKYDELEAKLASFEDQLTEMQATAESRAVAEREKLLADARAEAAALKDGARRSIRDETDRAVAALRKEAAAQAVALATQKAAALIDETDHNRLDHQFLHVVNGGKPAGVTHG